MTDASAPLADQAVRERIAQDLDTTLFVSAGAGSGKTTQLVDRVVALVAAGSAIESIAAITFTEKAADELRHRVRVALQQRAGGEEGSSARFATGLDDLDQAALCTLHSFAQRVLTAFPLEAGLPPAITVQDEIASELDFDQRFRAFYAELIERPELQRTLTLGLELGISDPQLRAVAERLEDNWDLLRWPESTPPDPPPIELAPLIAAAHDLAAACAEIGPTDRLAECLMAWLPQHLAQLEAVATPGTDELDVIDVLLRSPAAPVGGLGGAVWNATAYGSAKGARDAAKGLVDPKLEGSALSPVIDTLVEPILARLGAELVRFTLQQAEERSHSGRLTFHDLLVLCRRLVQHPEHGGRVRQSLARKYQSLLVDEYQDTDPLQLDIVVAIATPPGDSAPRPGRLFFVGDPKQSLYRFRRADIDLFLRTPDLVGAETISLTTNFRSTPPIIGWVNHVFDRLIESTTADDGRLAQPDFEALDARPAPALHGPPVTVLGSQPHPARTLVTPLREAEAEDVAAIIDRIRLEGWQVRPAGGRAPRAARLSDIAILIPARTALGQLESALRQAEIPYRLDTGSLVYAADEIRALLLALRAIDDPSDHLAVLSVLRSSLYGCSDVDLYRWRVERGGRWTPLAPRPPRREGDDAVWDALADLDERIAARPWRTPSQHLDSLVRDRRVLEAALAGPSPLDAWHRVRFVIEHARAWTDAGGRFLRDYLGWTRRQTGLTGRVAEAVLEDADEADGADDRDDPRHGRDDAVRILTVHGSKGLEFPIVIVGGFNSPPGGRRAGVQVAFGPDGDPILRLRQGLQQQGFDDSRAIDEQMDEHERIRLLYVACTRARDHLVVSLHRVDDTRRTGAHLLAECVTAPEDLATLAGIQSEAEAGATPQQPRHTTPVAPVPVPQVADLAAWRRSRAALVAAARVPGSVAATSLAARALVPVSEDDDRFEEVAEWSAEGPDATPTTGATPTTEATDAVEDAEPGLAKRAVDLDLPAWRKGRYGTAIGRAVHAVLQVVDLATGEGLAALARAQATAEGIEGEHEHIAALARSALDAPCVIEAAGSRHWREVYVGVPIGDTVLEGYVDLLYRRQDGLVVVDHKTDQVTTGAQRAAKLAAYRLQLAAYALAVERATGTPVIEARLVFCAATGASEEAVPDLPAAMEEAAALIQGVAPPAGQADLFDARAYSVPARPRSTPK